MEREETEEKESVRKTEKERHEMKYKVGDKVRVIKATSGCMGAEGSIGVVTDKKNTDGLLDCTNGFNIELKNGKIWRIGFESVCEPVEDELTAEEATKILGEICCENRCYNGCPIGKARGKMSCHFFRRDKPKEVLEILKQWKKEHEKKEVEVTQKIYCLVVNEERKVVHEEEIGNSDFCMDVLKNYCENHDGKFFSLMEFRYEVKRGNAS